MHYPYDHPLLLLLLLATWILTCVGQNNTGKFNMYNNNIIHGFRPKWTLLRGGKSSHHFIIVHVYKPHLVLQECHNVLALEGWCALIETPNYSLSLPPALPVQLVTPAGGSSKWIRRLQILEAHWTIFPSCLVEHKSTIQAILSYSVLRMRKLACTSCTWNCRGGRG